VATWSDVRRIALALPAATERASRGLPQWRVRDKLFAQAWLALAPRRLADDYLGRSR
jgi:hypothetical protein